MNNKNGGHGSLGGFFLKPASEGKMRRALVGCRIGH